MNWLVNLYRNNLTFRSFVQALEGGLIVGFMTATANGIDFSKKGIAALGSAVLGGVLVAIRNYFLNRPNQPATSVPPAQTKQ